MKRTYIFRAFAFSGCLMPFCNKHARVRGGWGSLNEHIPQVWVQVGEAAISLRHKFTLLWRKLAKNNYTDLAS